MARKRSPARLVIALSVAGVLAVFLLYTSLAGGGTPQVIPTDFAGHTGKISLVGKVVGPVTGDAHAGGLHFGLVNPDGAKPGPATPVQVVMTGTVPDLFKPGRTVVANGTVHDGRLVADELLTKCPSKYAPAPAGNG